MKKYFWAFLKGPLFKFIIIAALCSIIYKLDRKKNADEKIITTEKIVPEAYSSGETILIQQVPYDYKYPCLISSNWQKKEDLDFKAFLQSCPQDLESKIYVNNQIARTKASENSKAIVVKVPVIAPIGDNLVPQDIEEAKNSQKKINGKRVFESFEILKGVELAQREINTGTNGGLTLGDRKVYLEVVIVDDSYRENIYDNADYSTAEKAQRAANFLVSDKNIIAGIGHFSSDSLKAAAPIYKSNKLVVFSPTSTAIRRQNNWLSNLFLGKEQQLKLNPYIYRTIPNDEAAIDKFISIVKAKNENNTNSIQTVVTLYETENDFSELYKEYFEKKFSEEINGGQVLNPGNSANCRFTDGVKSDNQVTLCTDFILDKQPDLLLLVPSTKNSLDTAGKVLKNIQESPELEKKPVLFGADSMYLQKYLSEIGEGLIVFVPIKPTKIGNTQLNWRSGMAYDAMMSIATAIRQTPCDETADDLKICLRNEMKNTLEDKDFISKGVLGSRTVSYQNGDRVIEDKLDTVLGVPLKVKSDENKRFDWLFYNIYGDR